LNSFYAQSVSDAVMCVRNGTGILIALVRWGIGVWLDI